MNAGILRATTESGMTSVVDRFGSFSFPTSSPETKLDDAACDNQVTDDEEPTLHSIT